MNWKKRWLDELENEVPKAEQLNITPTGGGTAALKKKATVTAISCFAAVALLLTVFLILWFCLFNPVADDFEGNFVTVEINPSIMFSVDENGKIIKAVSLNNDADVILSNDEAKNEIIGKTLGDAVNAYVKYAAKLGYVNLLSDAVKVYGTDKTTVDNTVESLKSYLKKDGIFAAVLNGGVDIEKIAQNCSANSGTISDIANAVKEMNVLNVENETKSLSIEELIEEYKDKFLKTDEVKAYIKELIRSADSLFLGEAEKELIIYLIDNDENFFESIDVTDIIAKIETFSSDVAEKIKSIINLPESREEFISKVTEAMKIDFEVSFQNNKDKYDLPRSEISDEDYEEFVDGIIKRYGTLDKFWENKGK
ncbi:MAG: hypothetical protein ACI4MT_00560 [Christensenellales bacterium]